MVSDYCKGGDLGKILDVEQNFKDEIARKYIAEVIVAIEKLHSKNILYWDLKPDNILIDQNGHIKLTDFGLSKENVFGLAQGSDSFCGSIAYLSPEVLNKKGHGKMVDFYLIGVLLYEFLTG